MPTYVIGPRNPKTRADLRVEVSFRVDAAARRIIVLSEGSPKELAVNEGGWSDWLRVKFKLGLLQSIRGMVRFHLVQIEPDLAVYASPVNFDPDAPFFPISDPPEYAGDLAARIGLISHDRDGRGPCGIEQRETFRRSVSRPVLDRLARSRGDDAARARFVSIGALLLLVRHARPDPASVLAVSRAGPSGQSRQTGGRDFAHVIDDAYRRCDAIVGKALEYSDEQTLFIALSDHGFNSFTRGVHLNKWLLDNGFLGSKPESSRERPLAISCATWTGQARRRMPWD